MAACNCEERTLKPPRWIVIDRYCNYSAFNGGKRTRSDYSGVMCLGCGRHWRTKANYISQLEDAPAEWWNLKTGPRSGQAPTEATGE